MLNLKCKIEITSKDTKTVSFDYVNSIEVKTSTKNLTDTAIVKVPRKMRWNGKPLTDFIKRDDRITIQIGYEEQGLQTVFTGYLTGVKNSAPLVLTCENEMYPLKKGEIVPAENFDIKEFFQKYVPGVKCEIVGNMSVGSVNFENRMTVVEALDKIMQVYPYIRCYFQDDVFYAVANSMPHTDKKVVFDPTRNMITDELKYTHKDDVKICVKAVSILDNNKKLEAYAPTEAMEVKAGKNEVKSGYVLQHFSCPHCKTEKELQDFADNTAKELVANKMSGNFKAFGIPFVRKGDIVELRDEEKPERHKKQFVAEAVDYSFGTGGYRQTITLGNQV